MPGGFGERGSEGKIKAAQFARERNVPYFGICFGMQMAVIEAARNLAGIERRGVVERVRRDRRAGRRPDDRMAEGQRAGEARRPNGDLGGTMRLGAYPADADAGTQDRRDLWRERDLRAPPPPLRSQHRLQETRWKSAGMRLPRACRRTASCPRSIELKGPSVVRGRAVSTPSVTRSVPSVLRAGVMVLTALYLRITTS